MLQIKLKVIPEPAPGSRAVFEGPATPFFRGDGHVSHLCGGCGAPLTEGVLDGHLVNLVLKCPLCSAYNEV